MTNGRAIHAGADPSRAIQINALQTERFTSNYISTAKYSILSFIPAFLFEQFRRYSNIFFLVIALLQQIPDVSPTGRYTTLVPLIVILSVSALKEMAEDAKRHRADREVNNREVDVLTNGEWQLTKWLHVGVGNFVRIKNDSFFPADMVLYSSSDSQGLCYVETANLDGETNLKVRQALPETAALQDASRIANLQGNLTCELPNRHLYEFAGRLQLSAGADLALKHDQILLRGAKLQNTSWIIGQVVYTGHETKLMKNSTAAPLKRSTLDKQMNTQIIMLFILLFVIAFVSALFSVFYIDTSQMWYLPKFSVKNREAIKSKPSRMERSSEFAYTFLTFLILYNNLIPISMSVTLEVVRFLQALFINWDVDMHHKESDTPAMARTSNLNEELGQVRYVFSDKTGTLTRNIMEFKACSVGGKLYPTESLTNGKNLLLENINNKDPTANDIRDFLILLSVCHTVIPDFSTGELVYHAASPDERALVLGAKTLGYKFETRTPKFVEITAINKKETYEILNVLEFTSTRKRMSVIVKTPEGKIRLFCKGADSIIYDRLSGAEPGPAKSSDPVRVKTLDHLQEFAKRGLRTLCVAVAEIPHKSYEQWQEGYHRAATAINNREEKLDDASSLIEKDLRLIGATAIEDKLQDLVPETIAALLEAGIHVWVLTGDKQETAINVGYSCKLLNQSIDLVVVNAETLDATREAMHHHIHALAVNNNKALPNASDTAVIIDGKSLHFALTEELRSKFLELCCSCRAVICCRTSPLQKAEVVEYVTAHTGAVTLAIGDGANDVAMIQKAHVGIGISGQEGLQASCASDYAIAQFHFLRKLLFVHGAWNFDRMCKCIFYSYYKNICLYVIELWFAMYSAWSGQVIFDRWTIGLYNMLFTCWQPICMGVFDRNCSEKLRMKYLILYHPKEYPFSLKKFFIWIGTSILHSILLYWLSYSIYGNGIVWSDGKEGGYLVLGNFIYTVIKDFKMIMFWNVHSYEEGGYIRGVIIAFAGFQYVVVVVSLKSGLETKAWTIFAHLSIWGSILLWVVFLFGYSYLYYVAPLGADIFGIGTMVYTSPIFWVGLIVVPTTTLLPDIVAIAVNSTLYQSTEERFRQCEVMREDPSVSKSKERKRELTEQICPSEFSFIGEGYCDSSSSSSPSPASNYSSSTGSPDDRRGITNTDKYRSMDMYRSREEKKAGDYYSSGDKPNFLPDIPIPKSEKVIFSDDLRKYSMTDPSPKQKFASSTDKDTQSLSGKKKNNAERTPTKSGNLTRKTHPSTHPSVNQTRTKIDQDASNANQESSLNSNRQKELRTLLQRWVVQNRKSTSVKRSQRAVTDMTDMIS